MLGHEAARLSVAFPDSADAPDVRADATAPHVAPAPGVYDFVGSTQASVITLRSGAYYIDHLSIGAGTELRLNNASGPIFIYVRESFSVRGSVALVERAKWNALFVVATRQTVRLNHDGRFEGTIIAPKTAELRIDPSGDPSESSLTAGSFFGRAVFAGYKIEHHPFVRDDCEAESCGVFGCDTADRDGDGLYDCQENGDEDSFTDPDRFNGLRAYSYRTSHRSIDPAAIDSQAEVDASVAEKLDEHNIYSGWDLPGEALIGVGCRHEVDFWPPWPVCREVSYPAFNYSGYIKLAQSGSHCFEISKTSSTIVGSLFVGDLPSQSTSDGRRCFSLPAGVYPIRFMVEYVGLPDAAAFAADRFKVAYCAGDCEPTEVIPSSMLQPEAPVSCEEAADCANGRECLNGTCHTDPRACQTAADCASAEVCGTDNGAHFGLPQTADVCWLPVCEVPAVDDTYCGQPGSPCGTCDCSAACLGRSCGDSDDGCGGICSQLCDDGEPGCSADIDCPSGSVCGLGIGPRFGHAPGSNVCWPQHCAAQDTSEPNCGVGSECGVCPACEPRCAPNSTGPDGCGGFCGACPAGIERSPDGSCPIVARSLRPLPPDLVLEPVLPTEATGALEGQFKVTDRGTAAYSIPIETPPGRLGMTPNLALVYGSTKNNGFVGMGWSLSGLSAITRCGSIKDREGKARPVMMDEDDRLCLDGQPLVRPVGASGYFADGAVYYTEIDSFSRVVAHGLTSAESSAWASAWGPGSFEVSTKDGRILTFGATEDSSVWVQGPPAEGGNLSAAKRIWALSSVRDRSGNEMSITYRRQRLVAGEGAGTTAEIAPKTIAYGGNGDAGIGHSRFLKFTYENRPDPRYHYVAGVRAIASLRLTSITTYLGAQALNRYHVGYQAGGSGESLVSEIKYCALEQEVEQCTRPTSFGYRGRQATRTINVPIPEFPGVRGAIPIDFNGDGRQEILFSEGGGWSLSDPRGAHDAHLAIEVQIAPGCHNQTSVIDVNRDGREDLVDLCPGTQGLPHLGENEATVRLATGSFAAPFTTQNLGFRFAGRLVPADLDGDGLKDLVNCLDSHDQDWPEATRALHIAGVYWNRGTLFERENLTSSDPLVNIAGLGHGYCEDLEALDVNGDGDEELVQFVSDDGRITVWSRDEADPSAGTRWRDYGAITRCDDRPFCSGVRSHKIVDANGDGLDDLALGAAPSERRRPAPDRVGPSTRV